MTRLRLAAAVGLALSLSPGAALALQPLDDFLASARRANLDRKEAELTHVQRAHEADQAWRRLLPAFTGKGQYTFNQYEAALARPGGSTITITPQHQLDAFLTVDVPLVDLGAWAKIGAGEALSDAAGARLRATELDVERTVARQYFQVVASRAVLAASQRTLETSRQNLAIAEERRAAGFATDLDVARGAADVERARQTVASADYLVVTSERALRSSSGVSPEPGGGGPEDDLHEEGPLAPFLAIRTPSREASDLEAKAQDRLTSQTRAQLLPALSASATQRFTNAVGFADRAAIFTANVALTWRLDASSLSATDAQAAQAEVTDVRRRRTSQAHDDTVHDAWNLVRAQIASLRAARAEATSAALAARLARDRYAAGTALQIDALEAERRSFQAEVARIQADGDLRVARASLRAASGTSIAGSTPAARKPGGAP